MMLNCISVTITNNYIKAGIEIESEATNNELNSESKIIIKRRSSTESQYIKVMSKDIESIEDLTFDIIDITALSNKKYLYAIEIYKGDNIAEFEEFGPIESQFSGMYIGDNEQQYLAPLDFDITIQRNRPVAYVTTLSNRTPFAVTNEVINYTSGDASGLFVKYSDEEKRFLPDNNHEYSKEVIDFLSNGSGKILKMGDGRAWYVSINDTIAERFDERYMGYNIIDFSFVEIGDIPIMDTFVEVK